MENLNIFIRSIFIDNMIFAYFLGMCSFIAVSKNVKTAFGPVSYTHLDIGGDGVAYERYYHVGKGQHGYNRDAHHDGGLEFGGDGKYRADAEHLHYDGIVLREGIEEHVGILDFFSHKLWI